MNLDGLLRHLEREGGSLSLWPVESYEGVDPGPPGRGWECEVDGEFFRGDTARECLEKACAFFGGRAK